MSLYSDLPQGLTYAGGLLATTGALVAQTVSSDPAVGTGSYLLGGAGLIAALSAFTKDYWQDRQKQREHELAMEQVKARDEHVERTLARVVAWIKAARASNESLPPAPDIVTHSGS